LISLGISPGPLLFEQSPDLVWGLFAALFLANIVLLVLNLPLVGLFTRILALPPWFLLPFVVMVCFVGVYAINHSTFDLMVMTAFGVLGYLFRKLQISLVPVVLGLLLGDLMEQNLRRALSISGGDFAILFESPIALVLYAFTAVMLVVAVIFARRGGPSPGPSRADKPSERGT
jgi:putative tricarboxylic transport membrane protein